MNVELYLKEMGKRIMERRKKMGLTQEILAEKSELTTQFVSYAESGKRGMRPESRTIYSSSPYNFILSWFYKLLNWFLSVIVIEINTFINDI